MVDVLVTVAVDITAADTEHMPIMALIIGEHADGGVTMAGIFGTVVFMPVFTIPVWASV